MKSVTINNKELKILLEQLSEDKLAQLYKKAKSKVGSQELYESSKEWDAYIETEIVKRCIKS